MGFELLAPILGKLVAGLAAAAALIGLYFGIKHKGVREERERQQAVNAQAREAIQQRVDQARAQDRVIDAATQQKLDALQTEAPPPAPTQAPKRGDRFRF